MGLYHDLMNEAKEEIKSRKHYRDLADCARAQGYISEGNLIDAIADEEDKHANLLMTIANSIEAKGVEEEVYSTKSGVYVTITSQGGTTFNIGEVISAESFDAENERVIAIGEKPATGEYHY